MFWPEYRGNGTVPSDWSLHPRYISIVWIDAIDSFMKAGGGRVELARHILGRFIRKITP